MRVLGIDASTVNIGWAVLEYETEKLVRHGLVSFNPAKHPFYFRLKNGPSALFSEISIRDYGIKMMGIEHSFFTKNPLTGKQITMMIGGIIHAAMNLGCDYVKELNPTEIKKRFAQDGRAKKDDILNYVNFEYGIPNLSEDEADAIGAAVTLIRMHKDGTFERREQEKKEKRIKQADKRRKKDAGKKNQNLSGELKLH